MCASCHQFSLYVECVLCIAILCTVVVDESVQSIVLEAKGEKIQQLIEARSERHNS